MCVNRMRYQKHAYYAVGLNRDMSIVPHIPYTLLPVLSQYRLTLHMSTAHLAQKRCLIGHLPVKAALVRIPVGKDLALMSIP